MVKRGSTEGSIVLSTEIDTSGIKQGTKSMKSQAASLAAEYRKAGMTQSEAFKKAWSEIERTKSSTDKAKNSTDKYGKSAKKSGITAQNAFAGVGESLKRLAGFFAAAFSISKIIEFSKESSAAAAKAEASALRIADIYGEASDAVNGFIKTNAAALGLSKAAATNYAAVYGNLFSVWADQQTNAALTNKYLNMTAVVASKTGRTMEDVQERIRSGLLGNTEAVEDLGIFVNVKTIEMTDAFKRIANGRSWEQLTAYEQSQVRTLAILEQSTQKYGNQVADTFALTQARMKAAYEDFSATFGKLVNYVLKPAFEFATELLIALTRGVESIMKMAGITQKVEQYSSGTAANQEAITEEIEDSAKAQKKLLAGFDEINQFSPSTESESTGGANVDEIINLDGNVMQAAGESAAAAWFGGFSERFKEFINPLIKSVERLWKTLAPNKEKIKKDLEGLKKDVAHLLEWSIKLTIEGLDGLEKVAKFFKTLWEVIEEPVTRIWNEVLKPIISQLGTWIIEIVKTVGPAFDDLTEGIKENKEEIKTVVTAIGGILQLIWSIIKPIIQSVIDGISPVLKTTNDVIFGIIGAIANLIDFIVNSFQGFWALIQGDYDKANEHFAKGFQSFVNFFVSVANIIIGVINNLWTLIFDAFKGTVNSLGGLVGQIGDWLGQDWGWEWKGNAPLIPSIPKAKLPKLATGAVIPPNKEFLAVLGDQKSGTNIEAPLDTIKQALAEVMSMNNGFNGTIEVPVYLDGREVARGVRKSSESMGNQTVYGGFAYVH